MVSSACQNPSLTYMAFTARAADYAVAQLEKRRIVSHVITATPPYKRRRMIMTVMKISVRVHDENECLPSSGVKIHAGLRYPWLAC